MPSMLPFEALREVHWVLGCWGEGADLTPATSWLFSWAGLAYLHEALACMGWQPADLRGCLLLCSCGASGCLSGCWAAGTCPTTTVTQSSSCGSPPTTRQGRWLGGQQQPGNAAADAPVLPAVGCGGGALEAGDALPASAPEGGGQSAGPGGMEQAAWPAAWRSHHAERRGADGAPEAAGSAGAWARQRQQLAGGSTRRHPLVATLLWLSVQPFFFTVRVLTFLFIHSVALELSLKWTAQTFQQ